jgi:hypothetical protein
MSTFTFFAEDDEIEVTLAELRNRTTVSAPHTIWLDSTVTVQAGAFLGSFKASLTADDLVRLRDQLKSALTLFRGTVLFQNSGGGLSLSIKLDEEGKTSIEGLARPSRLKRGILFFKIATNRAALERSLHEIESAIREFLFQTSWQPVQAAAAQQT